MSINVEKEASRLNSLPMRELRAEWSRVWGEECRSWNRPHLVRRILWRMTNEPLSPEVVAAARRIAESAPARITATRAFAARVRRATEAKPPKARDPRLPPAGSVIKREYKGAVVEVVAGETGFLWKGERYGSLSAVAKAACGSHVNGFAFFRLGKKEER